MTSQDFSSLVPSGHDAERLLAEYREKIVKLEAHGLPVDGRGALWDVLGDILADIKRHQAPAVSQEVSRV